MIWLSSHCKVFTGAQKHVPSSFSLLTKVDVPQSMSHGSLQLVHFLNGKKHKVSVYPSPSTVTRLADTQNLSKRPVCERAVENVQDL
ncbi:hypothetical protein ROHU_027890 [Labeo rohita]|uniref:Uncharacterized protein n=1 Tax=Labeo rohita TaxID=84645 RepID=A0A498M4E8_LABRO|nr:hypothetical protein ROHU_027890 [Labeo rohita]